MVKKFFDYIFLTRFSLMPPVWTVFLLGYFQATFFGQPTFEPQFWASISFFSLLVGAYYIFNQLNDVESDKINNKLFILSQGLISVKSGTIFSIILLVIPFIYASKCGVSTGNWGILIGYGLSLIPGFGYNSKPFLWKDRPFLGIFGDAMGHGMIAYIVGWVSAGYELNYIAVLGSLAMTFGNAGIYLLTTIVDIEGDKNANKRTYSVVYGKRNAIFLANLFIVLALVASPILVLFTDYSKMLILPQLISTFLSAILFMSLFFDSSTKRIFMAFKYSVLFVTSAIFFFYPLYAVAIFIVFFGTKIYYKKRFNKNYPTLKAE